MSPPAPTCPRSDRVTGEGGRLSRAVRACPVEASFDGGPFGFRPRSCDLGRFPTGTCQANLPVTRFAKPSPEGSGFAGPSKKLGSAEASHFSFEDPSTASVACVPKDTARFRGGRGSKLSSVAGSPSLTAKPDHAGRIRFAQRQIARFCLWITGISGVSRRRNSRLPVWQGSDRSGTGRNDPVFAHSGGEDRAAPRGATPEAPFGHSAAAAPRFRRPRWPCGPVAA